MARTRVVLSGVLGTGNVEEWSCTFNYSQIVPLNSTDAQEAANDIVSAINAKWTANYAALKTLLSVRGALSQVDVYSYTGPGPASSHGIAAFLTPLAGSATAGMPPQACACYSLLTNLPGPSYRGRIYWPALGATMGSDLKSSTTKTGGPDLIDLATDIEDVLGPISPADWCVYSPKLDVLTPVSRVRAGDVVDTQRRRRDALVEAYTITPV